MDIATLVLTGVVVALVGVLVFLLKRSPPSDGFLRSFRDEFQTLAREALGSNSEQFLTLADERLKRQSESNAKDIEVKTQLIDAQLADIKNALTKVTTAVQTVDTGLTTRLKSFGEQTAALTATTDSLRRVLGDSRARGQWGERMAEDVLRAIGFVEGINYHKQVTLDGSGSRPDFVFLLPGGLHLNMDVKFPFDNYRRLIEADGEPERQGYERAFLRDVRDRIKEVATREYVDPEGGTVNYALMFIPNESVYAFIHERDGSVFDESLQMKVVCCSPYMLYAMLALVDQAAKTLSLQKASEELLALYGRFSLEWGKFNGALETLGRRLDSTRKAYDDATGRRKNALQRPLDRIEALREQRGLPIAPGDPILPGDDGMLSLEDAEEEEEEEEKEEKDD